MQLLRFCLHNTYFSFQGQFCEQVEGAALGSPVSPIWLTCTWNTLNGQPSEPPPPPGFGLDMWMTPLSSNRKNTNRTSLSISTKLTMHSKFTVENSHQDGAIPSLDTIVKPQEDNTLSLTVYRNPMHTYQTFNWTVTII